MTNRVHLSRRGFLTSAAASALLLQAKPVKNVPVGLLIYSVLQDWKKDMPGTLAALAGFGYQGVELTQYEAWTAAQAQEIRKAADSLHLKIFSTHTEPEHFVAGEKMDRMIELNQILGTQTVCCVRGVAETPGGVGYRAKHEGADGWRELASLLQSASAILASKGMRCSFHNHPIEFQGETGNRPIDWLAEARDLTFHIDVNVCRRAGSDPIAFMRRYPGRTDSLLLTDGPADANRHAPLFGKGDTPWKEVFDVAENAGGVRFYLLTHGAAAWSPMEVVGGGEKGYQNGGEVVPCLGSCSE
jgi:sugar phosphate isomerase/epimerase